MHIISLRALALLAVDRLHYFNLDWYTFIASTTIREFLLFSVATFIPSTTISGPSVTLQTLLFYLGANISFFPIPACL